MQFFIWYDTQTSIEQGFRNKRITSFAQDDNAGEKWTLTLHLRPAIKANLLEIVDNQIETSFKEKGTVRSDAIIKGLLKVYENIFDTFDFEFSQT